MVLHDIVIKNKIRTDYELLLFGKKQPMEGKSDIQWWLLTHTHFLYISDLVAKAPGLNLSQKLSNLFSNQDVLNY